MGQDGVREVGEMMNGPTLDKRISDKLNANEGHCLAECKKLVEKLGRGGWTRCQLEPEGVYITGSGDLEIRVEPNLTRQWQATHALLLVLVEAQEEEDRMWETEP
jgi:hypothetical protein